MDVEPPHLLPLVQPDFWSHHIASDNIYEPLLRLDPRSYRAEEALSSTYTTSEDGRTFTFFLRAGVRWHDGRPFGGKDVKGTFDRLMDENVRATSMRASLGSHIESYELLAPDRFRIVCRKPSPFFLAALSQLDILPAHLAGQGDLNTGELLRKPVGTGPYRFVSWEGGKVTLERNDAYWGRAPRIRRLVYRKVESPDMALKLARRGELDFVPRVRPEQWVGTVLRDPVLQHEFVRTKHVPPGITYIMLNHKRDPLSDRRVRLALAMMLDLDTVIAKLMHGLGQRLGTLYGLGDPERDASIQPIPYAPTKAKALLSEAGFADSNDDGVLDRKGEPLRFTFLWVTASQNQKKWLTLYQQSLRKAGVMMEISPIDWPAYLERIRKHDFDAGALGMRFTGPQSDLYEQLHSSQVEDGQNYGAYVSAEADSLMERIRTEMDAAKRQKLSHALQRLLKRDVALIPLFAEEEPGIIARRVHGVYPSALWYQVRDWWIE